MGGARKTVGKEVKGMESDRINKTVGNGSQGSRRPHTAIRIKLLRDRINLKAFTEEVNLYSTILSAFCSCMWNVL